MNTVVFSFYFSAIMMIQISSPTAEKFHQKGIKCKVYSQQKTKKKAHSWEKKKKMLETCLTGRAKDTE